MSFLATMLDMLTGAYSKSDEYTSRNNMPPETNIGKLFAVADWGLSLIGDNAEHIRLWSDIDNAEGAALDRHGANFGVARGDADDTFYRLLIRIKLLAQISGGDIDTILSAISGLYEIPAERIELYEIFPAKVQIAIFEDDLPESYMDIRDLVGMLTKRLLAAGIGLDMIYKSEDRAEENLYIGGRSVAEFTRIRLENNIQEMPDLDGTLYIGARIVGEFSRIRLDDMEDD